MTTTARIVADGRSIEIVPGTLVRPGQTVELDQAEANRLEALGFIDPLPAPEPPPAPVAPPAGPTTNSATTTAAPAADQTTTAN
jgi:hypothetical protein